MRYIFLLLSTLLIISCADSHQIVRTSKSTVHISTQSSAYISIPRDGRYGSTLYYGSGATVSQAILLGMSKQLNQVETGHEYESYKEALATAKTNKVDYLIFPVILEWEDRATEWSGIPDKASIKISIIQTSTGKTLDSIIIKGRSGIASFGGDHPQDLLTKPIAEYVKTLF